MQASFAAVSRFSLCSVSGYRKCSLIENTRAPPDFFDQLLAPVVELTELTLAVQKA
jgi:hypothetical protein